MSRTIRETAIVLLLFSCAASAAKVPSAMLAAGDLLALHERFGAFADELPAPGRLGLGRIISYEENKHFTYILGDNGAGGAGPTAVRRIILLKPAVFVVEDVFPADGGCWTLKTAAAPRFDGSRFSIPAGTATLRCETLFPDGAKAAPVDGGVALAVGTPARCVHVIDLSDDHVRAACRAEEGRLRIDITAGEKTMRLALPATVDYSATVAVSRRDGTALLPERLLPAGIMPHGPKGVRLMQRWDGAYRRSRMPGWDVGRPASRLKKAVEDKTIAPGRAVVLGCGTGTNAIYLARKGFDVTALDVAPTALTLAEKKARKAGVRVRWLMADVVTLPDIGTYDFIFDRGCYHHVQTYDAQGFVKTVCRLSRKGSLFLLLAGNANEPRRYGPPRVSETRLCDHFADDFAFQWLREIRFDGRNPDRKGPLAWSLLLRRRDPNQ